MSITGLPSLPPGALVIPADLDDPEVRLALTRGAPVCATCRHYGHAQDPDDACRTLPQCLMEQGIRGEITAEQSAMWSCRLHQSDGRGTSSCRCGQFSLPQDAMKVEARDYSVHRRDACSWGTRDS